MLGYVRCSFCTTPHPLTPPSHQPASRHAHPPLSPLSHGDFRTTEKCKFLCYQDITVQGFNYGIDIAQGQYGVTFERVTLAQQKIYGIRNSENQVYIEDFRSESSVPVIVDSSVTGLLVVIGGRFIRGSPSVSAIDSTASIYLRDISASGYRSVVKYNNTVIEGLYKDAYISKPDLSLFPHPRAL